MQEALDSEVRALGCEVVERGNYMPWWKLRISPAWFWLVYSVDGWRAGCDGLDVRRVLNCTPAPSAALALYSAVLDERTARRNQLIWLQSEYDKIREAARDLRQRVESAEEGEQ